MQPRTKNEKILLGILVGILFVGGNFFGYQWLSQKQTSLEMKDAELRTDKAEAEADLQKLPLWKERKEWIKANEPIMGDEGDTKAQVLEFVLKGARDHNLEILEQSLNDVQVGTNSTQVNVSLKVKGAMQGLAEWLTDVEKPKNFYAVSLFSLKADQDQKSMVCTLHLARYFKKGP